MPLVAQPSGFCEHFHYRPLAAMQTPAHRGFYTFVPEIKLLPVTQHVLFVAILLNATLGTKHTAA